MYRWGHVGVALFVYAPVAAALTARGDLPLALVGAAVAVALSTLPDVDELDGVPVDHRGPTHTVWFVLAGTGVAAGLGALAGAFVGRPAALSATAGGAALVALGSHLVADSVTPMGVRPFYPLSAWHHSFDVTPAKNPRANVTMLAVGALFALACQAVVLL